MSQLHILLVEDEVDGQEVVSTILEMNGMTVDVVGDGQSALTKLKSTKYDIAILDIALPDIDGWGILQEIRDSNDIANMYCIAITAYHDSAVRQRSVDAGFDDYLPKPINANQLNRAIGKYTA